MVGLRTTFVIILLTVSAAASAEILQGTPQEQSACRPDVRKFCARIKTNAGNKAFLSCLVEHRKSLSEACLTVLRNHNVIQ
jgi:hypothetical protein